MAGSAFDQRFYALECPECHVIEAVRLGDLQRSRYRRCLTCGHEQDLTVEPLGSALKEEFVSATRDDAERSARGEVIRRES
jgi:hypothetical protein